MSARKWREWQMYAELEPFGAPAAFWQAGLIASVLANVNRTKKSQKALHPEDFMPATFKAEPEQTTAQDVAAQIVSAFQAMAQGPTSRRRHE